MTRLLALWKKEWLALWRDKHGLLALFVMPAIFILIMSLALQDAFAPDKPLDLGYAVADMDRSTASAALIERLRNQSSLRDQGLEADMPAALASMRARKHAFVLVIPSGFERSMQETDGHFQLEKPLQLLADPTLTPGLELAFRDQILAVLGAQRVNTFVAQVQQSYGVQDVEEIRIEDWRKQLQTVSVHGDQANSPMPNAVQQSVPAWLIFSMFFVIVPISAVFITERQQGTLQRLRSQGVSHKWLLAGKLLPFFWVNQIQALLMLLVGRYLVPVFGGASLTLPASPAALLALWLMACAVSLAAVCWALLIASLVRTSEQATVIGGVGNILMGAVGGIMVPQFLMPPAMRALAKASPMAWGLEGFHTVLLRHGGIGDIWPYAACLLLFAAASLLAAALAHVFSVHRHV